MHLDKPAECDIKVAYRDGPKNILYVLNFNGHARGLPSGQPSAVINLKTLLNAHIRPARVHEGDTLLVTDIEPDTAHTGQYRVTGIALPEHSKA